MTAQEWLYWHDNFTFHPEYDTYFVAKVCEAAAIIRAQQERIEMLEADVERMDREIEGDLIVYSQLEESHRAVNHQLRIEGKRAQDMANLAAARLADQEAIERHVSKRVAGEIMAEIDDLDVETDADFYLCGYIAANFLRYRIRKKYGVTE